MKKSFFIIFFLLVAMVIGCGKEKEEAPRQAATAMMTSSPAVVLDSLRAVQDTTREFLVLFKVIKEYEKLGGVELENPYYRYYHRYYPVISVRGREAVKKAFSLAETPSQVDSVVSTVYGCWKETNQWWFADWDSFISLAKRKVWRETKEALRRGDPWTALEWATVQGFNEKEGRRLARKLFSPRLSSLKLSRLFYAGDSRLKKEILSLLYQRVVEKKEKLERLLVKKSLQKNRNDIVASAESLRAEAKNLGKIGDKKTADESLELATQVLGIYDK